MLFLSFHKILTFYMKGALKLKSPNLSPNS